MRPGRVVVLTEVLDDDEGLCECLELFTVETLVAEATMEALNKSIFPRVGGHDINGRNLISSWPLLGSFAIYSRPLPKRMNSGAPGASITAGKNAMTS